MYMLGWGWIDGASCFEATLQAIAICHNKAMPASIIRHPLARWDESVARRPRLFCRWRWPAEARGSPYTVWEKGTEQETRLFRPRRLVRRRGGGQLGWPVSRANFFPVSFPACLNFGQWPLA
ncbi:hypothetical protein SJA_C2-00030 [Sphingobium indicum UT26S]|uniref:Uncharacterized protein n=1 Tax=Sphingobium indicum (strain DSM 16413 / CCM 7287 / MTCC 6362 / UT26 / NBRC 101211 / UT26S) TaxID=452662 RepID=D4Z797_SPHIU|nr:hypothetical protein SJA_C2-00030 [Sphingobium indicum UT26S]